jgi:hypothetical protein
MKKPIKKVEIYASYGVKCLTVGEVEIVEAPDSYRLHQKSPIDENEDKLIIVPKTYMLVITVEASNTNNIIKD